MARSTKVRRIVFDTTNAEHKRYFAMLYQGFINGGAMASERKTIDVFRREAKVMDKLEDIGIAETSEINGVVWSEKTNELVLDQPEFDMLKSYFERTPWVTRVSREVVAVSDWLASHQPEEADA